MAKLVIYMSEYEVYDKFGGTPEVGQEFKVLERKEIMSGAVNYNFSEDTSSGWGGNMNRNIRRFHGWRGTTNDISTDALGIRRIEKVTEFKNGSVRILMSEDLHPELD